MPSGQLGDYSEGILTRKVIQIFQEKESFYESGFLFVYFRMSNVLDL